MTIKYLKPNAKNGFGFLKGINREPIPSQVSKMEESVKFFNEILRPVIVAFIDFIPEIKAGWYIIDGQHLFYAVCLRLKMSVPYIELQQKIKTLPDLIEKIALLNSSSKPWILDDYINTWSYYKQEYKDFKELFTTYNVERGLLAELLHTGLVSAGRGGSSALSKIIKQGELRIRNKTLAIKVLDYVSDLRSVIGDCGRTPLRVVTSVIIEKIKADGASYNHEEYKKYLKKNKEKFLLASNDVDQLRKILAH